MQQLRDLRPDVGVVAAYGEILRKDVLALPPLGYLNIHPSLLPLYRGPSPVTAALLAGDDTTGVSVMLLERAMDAGPILAQAMVALDPAARAGPLTGQLFHLGAELLLASLPLYASGDLCPVPQDPSRATFSHLLSKQDGAINWSEPAVVIERRLRAYDPWPGVWTTFQGQQVKIHDLRADTVHLDLLPGTIIAGLPPRIATGNGTIELRRLQPAGKRTMDAADWVRGQRLVPGQRLGD
ncbi:MAG: hypothetical protein NVS2B7_07940 [Herpetosiphon sp.]